MATQHKNNGRPTNTDRPPLDVRELQVLGDEVEANIRTMVPQNYDINSPAPPSTGKPSDWAPPAIRAANLPTQTTEKLRETGKLAAAALARQYQATAEAIEQIGREYRAGQNKLATTLIDEARYLEQDGEVVENEYKKAAEEYRQRAKSIANDIEIHSGKSDKAIAMCHDMVALLAATENQTS